jgi:cytidylate kinase
MDINSALMQQANLQFQKWESSQLRSLPDSTTERMRKIWERPVITISREPGCNSGTIATMLAKELGLDVFGIELVNLIAQNAHLSNRLVATLDEKSQTVLEDWLAGSVYDAQFLPENYLLNLRKVVYAIAVHGNAVILGRGSSFLLPTNERLALRFIAPIESEVKNVMQKKNLPEQKAREYVTEITQQRKLFIKNNFHVDVANAANYDLSINTASIQKETIISVIKSVLKGKMPE